MSKQQERRRENRIQASATTFDLVTAEKTSVVCDVVNLSRLGLGMELPEGSSTPFLDGISVGAKLEGTLRFAGDSLQTQCEVRVRKGRFLGLEYTDHAASFLTRLKSILTPQYVASSVHAIAPEFLAADIRAAYQADDFECIIFKPGLSGVKSMVQIYWDGKVVEVVDDVARFVPPLLVRGGMGRTSGAELLRSFTSLNDDGTEEELKEFFTSLSKVFASWASCPLELQGLLKRQLHS